MHLVVRENHGLEEADAAQDLGQSPAELVFLSFSDTDLTSLAAAWRQRADRPSLRLANLMQLRHPMSVDLYLEQVVAGARCVVIRLIGGIDYWRYGVEQCAAVCREHGISLAILSGDGDADTRLAELSTVAPEHAAVLDNLLTEGGVANAAQAIAIAVALARHERPPSPVVERLPRFGVHRFRTTCSGANGNAVVVLYRSHLAAGDIEPCEALAQDLAARGIASIGLYVTSLRDADAASLVSQYLANGKPDVILNATCFAARGAIQETSPLDAADAPVLQLVLAGTSREAWAASSRGLTPADLAMQLVLPELDGRLATTAISFKASDAFDAELEYAPLRHAPDREQIARVGAQAAGWISLRRKPIAERRVAIVLSDYPAHGGQVGHAIGLDAFASLDAIVAAMGAHGYDVGASGSPSAVLKSMAPSAHLDLARYRSFIASIAPDAYRQQNACWGDPIDIQFAAFVRGNLAIAVQPDRGSRLDRKADYHNPDTPPGHAYTAFYAWLQSAFCADAIVHLGAHGTMEWLSGKAAAASGACWPAILSGGLPVIYPFIVNNPGEAAPAKRRLGAVLIGHMTPPLRQAGAHDAALHLEKLIDEFAAADGLDRRRPQILRDCILTLAADVGLLAESGCAPGMSEDETLARLDAYLCDVKDLQIREGLHVFGQSPDNDSRKQQINLLMTEGADRAALEIAFDASPANEMSALLAALDGRFVTPGPSGAPSRGRPDVLPTGRNIFAVDPRSVPTRTALSLAERAAADLLRRHLQDHGDHLRHVVIDLWGGPAIRTGGEDFGLALVLMGVRPEWDAASNRVTGFEIVPSMKLDRPRVDVTLRVSGLFRDAFESQIALFDLAVQAVARLDEAAAFNPLAAAAKDGRTVRVFGSPPGDYGTTIEDRLSRGAWTTQADLGRAWLDGSAYAYGGNANGVFAPDELAERVSNAQALVHSQDHAEVDILDSIDFATHEGGFAAAASALGNTPALYHLDTSRPDTPRTRTAKEEVSRVVRGRAANPAWIAGMVKHGFRGAAEIARAVEPLFGFAATMNDRFDRQFDLLFDATLGTPNIAAFLQNENPRAFAAMKNRFAEALERDLWRPRRNATTAWLKPPGGA